MSGDKPREYTPEEMRKIISDASALFVHITPKCEHDFKGWREFEDGRGGEQVCTKCGIGAMADSLRNGP